MKKELFKILVDDVDEEILEKMPEWFKILRSSYKRK